jgi:hypothetical protein
MRGEGVRLPLPAKICSACEAPRRKASTHDASQKRYVESAGSSIIT